MFLVNEKNALKEMAQNHDCNASRDSGCECGQWIERIKQINLRLNELREEYAI